MAFTRHGHHIPGTIRDKYEPPRARCGGPSVCSDCALDVSSKLTIEAERPIRTQLQELTDTQGTIFKVYDALKAAGLAQQQALDAINLMQNAGIYFREAKDD